MGEYALSQTLALEAQNLAKLSANLNTEAGALWLEARCCRAPGNSKETAPLPRQACDCVACRAADGIM
jgi:hypothetical protein